MLLDDKTLVFFRYLRLSNSRMDVMKNRIQHIGLIIWLLVYVPFAQATFGEAVLCLGSDGHVALENSGTDGACHEDVHLSDVLDQDCLVEDHCGNCLDLLPSLDELNRSHNKLFLENALVVVDVVPTRVVSHPLQNPPVSFLKHLHVSVPTTVLQI